jgi:hypothetical protein
MRRSERVPDPILIGKGERMFINSRLGLFLLVALLCTPRISARQNHSVARPAERLAAESERVGGAEDDAVSRKPSTENAGPRYVDLPVAELEERIPELRTLRPARDQQELPTILQNMGRSMDDFARNIGDLIAHEDVTQQQLTAHGKVKAEERVQDNYLILRHGYEWGASAEYRMDDKGNRLGRIGLEKGYLVTSGYALSCISFSTFAQSQSRFRYLGEQKMDSRETYVLGFAQQPGEATFFYHDEGNRSGRSGYADAGNPVGGQERFSNHPKCGAICWRRTVKFDSIS